jgi:hypothetical protein
LYDNLSKIIRMSAPTIESLVTNLRLVRRIRSEDKLLHITDRLHNKSDGKENNASNISSSTKGMLRILRNIWRVQDRYWEGDDPDPDHLEDPEAKEFEEVIALVVETIIFASFEDTEEEETRESKPPDHDEDRVDDLACIVVTAEGEGDDC